MLQGRQRKSTQSTSKMASFDIAVELVLQHEGGYTPGLQNDPGGATNFGISKRAYPELDIEHLTREQAIEIYAKDYWRFDSVVEQPLANCLLDASVNQGLGFTLKNWHPDTTLKEFQLARLLRYAALNKPGFNHSWFHRTLDV